MTSKLRTGLHLAGAMAITLATLSSAPLSVQAAESAQAEGQKLAFDRKKGNCLACHQIEGGEAAGTIAPPLFAMKQRFPDRARLRAQIWDATAVNSGTAMPPFGRHKILNEREIDTLVDYIWSL